MGRLPSNGGPSFRFSPNEVAEMENILREHKAQVPSREALEALAAKFSSSEERSGKMPVQMKQVWNWFQNRRYALRAKQTMSPLVPRFDANAVRNVPQAPNAVRNVHQAPQSVTSPLAHGGGKHVSDNAVMEFEAKSARDGAWYDVASFLSHRSLETDTPEVLVRFAGFGAEEDEWVNIRKHVRPRSLPCESTECVAILPGDLILCFQEGKEQALYYDAHVIDSQRRRHDARGCRCRFLVRYDHDQSEEIVPLRKVCRRPETDYRLLQLQSMNESGAMKQQKTNADTPHMGNTLRVYPPSESMQKPQKAEESLSYNNRPIATEVKIQQKKNPQVGAGGAINPPVVPPGFEAVTSGTTQDDYATGDAPADLKADSLEKSNPTGGAINLLAVPPGFEAVTSGTAKDDCATGDAPAEMKADSLEKNNPDVIIPVATEVKSLETKIPEVITPLASEDKTLQTKNSEKSAGGGVLATPTVPPGFEAVTSGAANNSASTDRPIAMEVKSLQTENPEVGAGNAGETTPTLRSNDAPTSANVTDSITSGNTPIAPEVKSLEMKIPIVPPGFEAVTSGNAPVANEIESLEAKYPEVTAGDTGVTSTVHSINEAVTSGTIQSSNASAETSVAMEVESPKTKDPEVGVTAVNTDLTENMLEG